MLIPDFTISEFGGIVTAIKDIKTLKPGISPDALNWITGKYKDHIELRRGTARLGTTEVTGVGNVSGIGVVRRFDGTDVLHFSYDQKVKYYDADADDTYEVGSDMLPAAASGQDLWFRSYQNLAGAFHYLGSKDSGVWKIPAANPGSAVSQSVSNYRWGVFHVAQGRAFAGQRNGTTAGNNDPTGLYLSAIDKDQLSDYTQITGEVLGTGNGATTTFSGILAGVAASRTFMYLSVTDTVETFTDDRNGNLVGSAGGTGTINYATGAYSITFHAAPANLQSITASYYWENSTSGGILDFTVGGNGLGKTFREDDGGGKLMALFNINSTHYPLHELKTWQLDISLDDTESTNLPYRNIGIPYERAAYQTPEGIILADLSSAADPKLRRLEVLQGTNISTIEPTPISDELDLSAYGFDKCVTFRWGDYEIFCVAEKRNGVANTYNSVMLARNIVSKTWDVLSYYAACLAEYEGTLVAGDSISRNVYTLFSGFDEDGDTIENYWTSSDLNLGTDNLKTCRRMVVSGLIQPSQSLKVSVSYDGGAYAEMFTIDGQGDYVDAGTEISIGSATIGSKTIGDGGTGSETASPFEVDFKLDSDRFEHARVKLEAEDVGFVSVNSIKFKDIRDKGRKNLPTRTH